MSNDKKNKIKPRLPRGLEDRGPEELRALRVMTDAIRGVYERYGFEAVETPAIEYTDTLGKFLPDSDRPNEGVFSFQDDDEQWMSLRYDLTAPLARYVAANFDQLPKPYRSYRFGNVFRNEKPGPGRFRQFLQFDADTVGSATVAADAEMCMMAADTLEALGIARGDYVIKVNNRKVLDGVMDAANIAIEQRLTVLRAIDKLDRLGIEGVKQLLGAGRKDESGDFTKGAGLDAAGIDAIAKFVAAKGKGNHETVDRIKSGAKFSPAGEEGIEELVTISTLVAASGYEDRVKIDPSVVRGLEYYTGPVYEAELTFDVTNEKGEKVQFGSVGGGGRYDGLVKRFTGQDVPATGFSIGVSRLMTALKNLGKLDVSDVAAPVLVTVMDRDTESLGRYQKFTQELRNAGIRAEMYQGNPKDFPKQLRYADRRNCPVAIIQGGNERNMTDEAGNPAPKLIVKDLIEGKRIAATISDNAEWREAKAGEHLVDEDRMLETVTAILKAQRG